MTFKLIGTLKKPIDIVIDNRTLHNVTRIIGNDEWGFLFEYSQHGKRYRTAEPYWHKGHEQHKRNDLPRLGSTVKSRQDNKIYIIQSYSGHGYYKLRDEQGMVITQHYYALA